MANKLKLSDNLYWDASGIIVRGYSATNDSTKLNMNVSRTLQNDFNWIDCGKYESSVNGAWNVGVSANATKKVTFAKAYANTPDVICCTALPSGNAGSVHGYSIEGATAVTKTGFTAYVINGNSGAGYNIDYFWISIGT